MYASDKAPALCLALYVKVETFPLTLLSKVVTSHCTPVSSFGILVDLSQRSVFLPCALHTALAHFEKAGNLSPVSARNRLMCAGTLLPCK